MICGFDMPLGLSSAVSNQLRSVFLENALSRVHNNPMVSWGGSTFVHFQEQCINTAISGNPVAFYLTHIENINLGL